jgi:hypothetical protein
VDTLAPGRAREHPPALSLAATVGAMRDHATSSPSPTRTAPSARRPSLRRRPGP